MAVGVGPGQASTPEAPAIGLDARERVVLAVERRWPIALALLLLADLLVLLYYGRGLTFFYDEWEFILRDYGGGLHSMLLAHVGNISIFPIASYKILFHLAGLNHYAIYRLVVIALHLLAGALVFAIASRRVGRVPALLASTLILFLGAAWEDLLWAFQVGYMLSIAGGLAAWALMDLNSRRGDIAAMLCLILAAGSSSLGIPVMAGVAIELAWRRQFSRWFVVAVPAGLYVLWYAAYGVSQVTHESVLHAPGFAVDLAAAAFGGLAGQGLGWGRPLALLALLLLLHVTGRRGASARLAGLIATGVALWVVTALARSTISPPESSRYIYMGAVVIVLTGVELLAGMRISARAVSLAAPFALLFALSGFALMHAGSENLRTTSQTVTAELGALELAGNYVPPDYRPDPALAPPVVAGTYLHTVRAMHSSPADSPTQLAIAGPAAKDAADHLLATFELPAVVAATAKQTAPGGQTAPLSVSVLGGGSAKTAGACTALQPSHTGNSITVSVTLPAAGMLVHEVGAARAIFSVKRFGDQLIPISDAPGQRDVVLIPRPDRSSVPWQAEVSSASQLTLCGLPK